MKIIVYFFMTIMFDQSVEVLWFNLNKSINLYA